jgi:dTDP-4-amino-4,6-dideoxygalactose transaminase
MIPLFKHFIAPEAAGMVATTLGSSCIGQGPMVDEFEVALGSWIGNNVTVNSGTSALWLAYDLAGIRPGDYVIATPMTCLLANVPLAHLGANILWADVYPDTGLIDPNSVEKLLKKYPSTVAICCVDYAGTVCDIPALHSLADEYHATLIVDAAHSFGANRGADKWDYLVCYSFQAIKHLTTGDGGAISIMDPLVRDVATLKRWCGLDRKGGGFRCDQEVTMKGYKFHMTDIAASIGLANLPHVQKNIGQHHRHALAYDDAELAKRPIAVSSRWMYNVMVDDRDGFVKHMAERGIQAARTHNRNDRHPIFTAIEQPLPGVKQFNDHQCSIPVGWWLSDEDVKKIIDAVQEWSVME